MTATRPSARASSTTESPAADQWAARLHALHELAVAAGGVLKTDALASLVAERANQLLGGDGAGLQVYDAHDGLLHTVGRTGGDGTPVPPIKPGEGAVGIAFQTKTPLPIEDYIGWNGGMQWVKDLGYHSLLAVPLLVQDRAIGTLTISFRQPHVFTVEEVELMSLLGAQVAPAMEAARLHTRLEASERQYRHIVATSPLAVLNFSMDGAVTSVNRSALKLLGYGGESQMIGLKHDDLVRYEEGEPKKQIARLARSAEPHYRVQRRCVRRDGSEFWAEVTVVLVRGSSGRPAFFYALVDDITERLLALEELRKSRERISVIIGNAPLILFALDAQGVVTLSEGRGLAAIGRAPGELVGASIYELYAGDPEIIEGLERALRGETTSHVAALPGSGVVLETRFASIRGEDGSPAGLIGVAFDISEQKRAERERAEAEEKLRQSYQALRDRGRERRRLMASLVTVQEEERRKIASGIHDDTLQVLANLGFHLERLRRRSEGGGADTDVLDHLDQSLQLAVDRLRRLVFDLRPTALDREGIVPALMFLLEEMRDETGMEVELTGAILAEPDGEVQIALYRIAREALANVRKHSQATFCELSLEEIDGWYHLLVRDDGVGFDPQAPPAPGHIGMTTMKERTLVLGGRMVMQSSPGTGTSVVVWLPGAATDAREGETGG